MKAGIAKKVENGLTEDMTKGKANPKEPGSKRAVNGRLCSSKLHCNRPPRSEIKAAWKEGRVRRMLPL